MILRCTGIQGGPLRASGGFGGLFCNSLRCGRPWRPRVSSGYFSLFTGAVTVYRWVRVGLWGLPRWSSGKESANAGDTGSIAGSGRSPREGSGNLLQYSCLENPTDRGAWQATVHEVAKRWTPLSLWPRTMRLWCLRGILLWLRGKMG